MKRMMDAWRRLRARYWLALCFDVVLIAAVFWAIHSWQTRDLPLAQTAPPLPGVALDGGQFESGLPGDKPGVVYFFAPWCVYCRHSIDNLDALVAAGRIGWARAVALDYADAREVREFVSETGLKAPVLLGDASTAAAWRVQAFPTYFVLGSDGQVRSSSVGYSTWLGMWWRTRK